MLVCGGFKKLNCEKAKRNYLTREILRNLSRTGKKKKSTSDTKIKRKEQSRPNNFEDWSKRNEMKLHRRK